MPVIKLKKPIEHDGQRWDQVDFDPTIDALEAFTASVKAGEDELVAVKRLLAEDSGIPFEIIGKLRMSDLMQLTDLAASGPFGDGSTPSQGGVASRPT